MSSDRLFLFAALAGAATFAIALYFQYFQGLAPCPLCMWQRYGLGVGILGAALAAVTSGRAGKVTFGTLGALGFLFEAGAAAFHTGVERKWWEGLPTCSGSTISDTFDPAALAAAASSGRAVPRCDEIAWDLLGLSMANWNVLFALGFMALCALGIMRVKQAAPESGLH